MKKCLNCNIVFNDDEKFCSNCGGALQEVNASIENEQTNQGVKDKTKKYHKLFKITSIISVVWGGILGILMALCIIGFAIDEGFNSESIFVVIILGVGCGILLASGILGLQRKHFNACMLLDSLYILLYIIMLFIVGDIIIFTVACMVIIPIIHIVFCDKESLKQNKLFQKLKKTKAVQHMTKKLWIIVGGTIVVCIIALVVIINITGSYTAQYRFLTYEVPRNFVGEESAEFNSVTYQASGLDKMGSRDYTIYISVEVYEGYYSDDLDWLDEDDDEEALQEAYDDAKANLADVENVNIDGTAGIVGIEYVPVSSNREDEDYGKYMIYNRAYFLQDNSLVEIEFYSYGDHLNAKVEQDFNKFVKSIKISR